MPGTLSQHLNQQPDDSTLPALRGRSLHSSASYPEILRKYCGLFAGHRSVEGAANEGRIGDLANRYYDLATVFYEIGWGKSFHFAPLNAGESRKESLRRYEMLFAQRLQLSRTGRVLDLGCGVCGPMVAIAGSTGASITGVNNNAAQVVKGRRNLRRAGLQDRCNVVQADFMQLPFGNASATAIYSIEAFPHAPDKKALFHEVFRVLRPGGGFAASDWCLTDRYDAGNADHRQILGELEMGNGLAGLATKSAVHAALISAGFEIFECRDFAEVAPEGKPWHEPLQAREGILLDLLGDPRLQPHINRLLHVLERMHILPRGVGFVHDMLRRGAEALIRAGQEKIFTPLFFWYARKPESAQTKQPSTSPRIET